MATTTAKAFTEFLGTLEPTDTERSQITGRSASVAGYLKSKFGTGSDMPLSSTKLIGSAAKGTSIHPVDDVDVLAVFGNAQAVYDKYSSDTKQFLYRVKNALDGYNVKVVGARGQAVRLFYTAGPYADIAPVLPATGGGYFLPAGDGSWIRTNPEADAKWLSDRRSALGSNLTPMIKLAKAWNRAHSSWFKSFHLEVMVAGAFQTLGSDYRSALKIWFEHPNMYCLGPASGRRLDDYMPAFSTRRTSATNILNASKERAVKALQAEQVGDHRAAIRLWGIILGSGFPTYG